MIMIGGALQGPRKKVGLVLTQSQFSLALVCHGSHESRLVQGRPPGSTRVRPQTSL